MGNVKRATATSIANDALELVHASDQEHSLSADVVRAAKEKEVKQAVANLQGKYFLHALTHPNADEKNCAVQLTVQLGQLDLVRVRVRASEP